MLIAGGGFAGLALALALRQGLGPDFAVTVADPAFGRGNDPRASAIAAAPRRMFEALGVWAAVAAGAQDIRDMIITDSRVEDAVRPVFLSFEGDIEPGEPFAHMIENAALVGELAAKAAAEGVAIIAQPVTDFAVGAQRRVGHARRWIGPHGEASRRRRRRPLAPARTCRHRRARLVLRPVGDRHDGRPRARSQRPRRGAFSARRPVRDPAADATAAARSSGPSTPRTPRASSRSRTPSSTTSSRSGSACISARSALAGPRRAYPLGLWVARDFVAERLALVGDAAHVIHPIAGQGLNMGLRDVAALAEAVVDAARLGLDPGDATVLERYQRWRRFDTLAMGVSTDSLNRLFSNRSDVLRLARDVGLGIVDRLPPLKRMFIREAAGLTGEVPKLLRGEAL